MIILPFLLASLSSYVVTDPCLSASLSPGGQALMVETSEVVRVETSDSEAECEVRLRLVAVGGGGDGDAFTGNAGGSGFVEYKEVLNFKSSVHPRIFKQIATGIGFGWQFALHRNWK